MNYKKILRILGKIMILEGILMLIPFIVSICYKESIVNMLAFLVPSLLVIGVGFALQMLKAKRNNLYQKEGFALVGLVWVVMTLFGAIPFIINREITVWINDISRIPIPSHCINCRWILSIINISNIS